LSEASIWDSEVRQDPNVAKAEGAADAGVKGEAVVVYADPLTTQQMLYHRLPKGKQHGCFSGFLDITRSAFHKITQKDRKNRLLLLFSTFCHVVYATIGKIVAPSIISLCSMPFTVFLPLTVNRLPCTVFFFLRSPFTLYRSPSPVHPEPSTANRSFHRLPCTVLLPFPVNRSFSRPPYSYPKVL